MALSIRLPNDVEARRENLVAKTGGEGVITLLKQFVSVWMTSKIYISQSSVCTTFVQMKLRPYQLRK